MGRESDGVQWLLNQAGRHHLLTADEEIDLARQIQAWIAIRDDVGDTPTLAQKRIIRRGERSFRRFFEANIRLVAKVAGLYSRRVQHMNMSDLIQEGSLGLIRAIEKFDPQRGYKFSTYGYWWIRQAITRAIEQQERTIRLPIHMNAALNKIRLFGIEFEGQHGRPPTVSECAAFIGLTETQVREMTLADRCHSLDAKCGNDADRSALVDLIADEVHDPLETLNDEMIYTLVAPAVKQLPEKMQEVIQLRFFNQGPLPTYKEIGASMGVSRERIRQYEKTAMNLIRMKLTRAEAA